MLWLDFVGEIFSPNYLIIKKAGNEKVITENCLCQEGRFLGQASSSSISGAWAGGAWEGGEEIGGIDIWPLD